MQDLPPCLAQFGIDHFADQLMGEVIATRATCPGLLLAQHPTCDGLLQGLDSCLHPQLSHLPQQLRARLGAQHGTGQHQPARSRRQLRQARLDHRAH